MQDSENEKRDTDGPSSTTLKKAAKHGITSKPGQKAPAMAATSSSAEPTAAAPVNAPTDTARTRPPLKEPKDDDSPSIHSSASGKSKRSDGARTDKRAKSPRHGLDMMTPSENHEYQCSQLGCGNLTGESKPGFCESHSSSLLIAEAPRGRILFSLPGCGDQEGITAFHFGDAKEEFVDRFCGNTFLATKWETDPETILVSTCDEHGPPIEFTNVEAAVQALRFWDSQSGQRRYRAGKPARSGGD